MSTKDEQPKKPRKKRTLLVSGKIDSNGIETGQAASAFLALTHLHHTHMNLCAARRLGTFGVHAMTYCQKCHTPKQFWTGVAVQALALSCPSHN